MTYGVSTSNRERQHTMLVSETPTFESMSFLLSLLKRIRAEGSYQEHQLRTMRHILALHLNLDGIPQPLPSRCDLTSVTPERILEMLSDGLLEIASDENEGEKSRWLAIDIINIQLGRTTAIPEPKYA